MCIIATVWQSVDCSFYVRNLVDKEKWGKSDSYIVLTIVLILES